MRGSPVRSETGNGTTRERDRFGGGPSSSPVTVRNADVGDLPTLLAINEAATPHVNSIPLAQLQWFHQHASYFRVAVLDDAMAGLLIALTPGLDYDSLNYRWFERRYESFVYVDRIITADWARQRGVGRTLYADLFAFCEPIAPVITCEVNLEPRNDGSLAFHREFGFTEVGTQRTEGGSKLVSLMVRRRADR